MKLGEADKIVRILSEKEGIIDAVAKGIRKTKSKFGGRLEPFTYSDLH
ncbi:DNA repair protein RecO (recombination protein O), partial [Candidatus Hakubella thermalkaliphila]